MNNVNKTLYIPLYGKAYVSNKGLFLEDKKAQEIWEAEGFSLKGKSKSKWLAYYMGIRSAVFDEWLKEKMAAWKDAVVIHMGCGMDSRVLRVGTREHLWYDVDFPEVIKERKRYYEESSYYHMIASDVRQKEWQEVIAKKKEAIIIMEGISMYMDNEALQNLLQDVSGHFEQAVILMDCYTTMAALMSKYKNPINDVGVSTVYGLDDPLQLQKEKVVFIKEHNMTPQSYIEQLRGVERSIFAKLYAGNFSKKLYRMYEYKKVK